MIKLGAAKYALKRINGDYMIETVNDERYTVSMVKVERSELDPKIADECDKLQGYVYNRVELKG